jgi:tetratricopeptide (TPR) repeat protein
LFISGKVVVDDGSELTDQATIQSICKGRRHMEGYTDSHGAFNLEMGRSNAAVDQDIENEMGRPQNSAMVSSLVGGPWRDCELQAVLPGFTSQVIELGAVTDTQNADVGRIVLHRLSQVGGFTMSATSAAAPEEARKAFAKGRELEQKKKWDKAEEKFRQAVQAFPRYAVAWVELGRLQILRKDLESARTSFERSIDADPRLVTPHQELARIAFNQKNWQAVADQTAQVVSLNPISFPQDWFLNSVANYFLSNFDASEKSARQGLKADVESHIPKLEYVLGMILLRKRDLAGAQEHMKNYVRLAPNDPEVPKVQAQIAELEKTTGSPAAVTPHP